MKIYSVVSLLIDQTNFKRDESLPKSPSASSRTLTMRIIRHYPPSLFRRKLFPTRSLGSTAGMCLEHEEDNEVSLVVVSESGFSSYGEVSEVLSSTSNFCSRSDTIT